MAEVTDELEVVRQMAGLMVKLDEDGKRRALWYLADLSGLSQRAAQPAQPQPMAMPPGVRMPTHQRPTLNQPQAG